MLAYGAQVLDGGRDPSRTAERQLRRLCRAGGPRSFFFTGLAPIAATLFTGLAPTP